MASAQVLPVNLYGPYDNFDASSSHVIPALINKMQHATAHGIPEVEVWGTGNATREFLYVTDAAEAVVRAAEMLNTPEPVNLGTGEEISIRNLAGMIAEQYGYCGELRWNTAMPDGQPRRSLNTSRAERLLNWRATTSLQHGLSQTVKWHRKSSEP